MVEVPTIAGPAAPAGRRAGARRRWLVGVGSGAPHAVAIPTLRSSVPKAPARRGRRPARAQERFERAFDDAPIGIALVALDGSFTRVNAALCEIVGHPAEVLERLGFEDLTHPEDLDKGVELRRQLRVGEINSYQLEKRYLHRDGHVVWVKISASLARDWSGEPRHWVWHIDDISERRTIEAALRASERRLESIAANVPGMVYRFAKSPAGVYSMPYASVGSREIYGVEAGELMADPRRAIESIHPEDAPEFMRLSAESAASGSRWEWHGRAVMPDGAVKHLHGSSQPSREPDGTVVWDGVLLDETEIHAALELEASTRLRLQLTLENLPSSAVTLYDKELRLCFCEGPLFEDRATSAMIGRRLPELVSAEIMAQIEPGLTAALEGRPSTMAIERDRNGRPLAVSFAPYRFRRDDRRCAGALAGHLSAPLSAERCAGS